MLNRDRIRKKCVRGFETEKERQNLEVDTEVKTMKDINGEKDIKRQIERDGWSER